MTNPTVPAAPGEHGKPSEHEDHRHQVVLSRLESRRREQEARGAAGPARGRVSRFRRGTPDAGRFVVVCAEAPAPRGEPSVRLDSCLAQTPLYRVVDLARSAGGVDLMAAECDALRERSELRDLARMLGPDLLTLRENNPDEETNAPAATAPEATFDVAHPPLQRREALGLTPPTPPTYGIHTAVDDHERLLESLAGVALADEAVPAPGLALTASGCVACGVCVRACPHDALELRDRDGQTSLLHTVAHCQGERACVEHCPVDALSDNGTATWGDVVAGAPRLLSRVYTVACARCGTLIPDTGADYCGVCTDRQRNPFGVNLPDDVLTRLGRGPDGRRTP